VHEVADDARKSGAIWIEPALSLTLYAHRFGGLEPTLKMLLDAAARAEESTGVAMAFIVAAERHEPPSEGMKLACVVRDMVSSGKAMVCGRLGIVGFGLHSAEADHPPEPFEELFRVACVGGVVPLPHAGEIAPAPGQGPASVRFCVDTLGAQRIEHGVLAIEDAKLVDDLAAKKVCLDVCPTSNLLLGVTDTLINHPLPRLLSRGVPCTINSDDPLLFGCSLLSEYDICRTTWGMSDLQMAECARTSFVYSRAPPDLVKRGLTGITDWLHEGTVSTAG